VSHTPGNVSTGTMTRATATAEERDRLTAKLRPNGASRTSGRVPTLLFAVGLTAQAETGEA